MSALTIHEFNLEENDSVLSERFPLIGQDLGDQLEFAVTEGLGNVGDAHGSWIDTVFRHDRHRHALEGIIVTHQESVFPGLRLRRQQRRNTSCVFLVILRSAHSTQGRKFKFEFLV